MLTLRGIITLIVLIVLFALAVVWISKQGGWKGEGKLIDRLKQTAIPLRIYGDWQSLSYSLQVDQILRKQLQDEAKQRLNDWVERNKGSKDGNDAKKLLDKL